MLDVVTFDSGVPGAALLVTGAVHGNEVCGPAAIYEAIEKFRNGAYKLLRGRVIFVPVCNPLAYEKNTRFVDRNLNRFLFPVEAPRLYEEQLGNYLCPVLRSCDVLLDLHAYHVGGAPFVFVEEEGAQEERAFAYALGAEVAVMGWPNAYKNVGHVQEGLDVQESMGTTEYARLFGAIAVTLECGQLEDPASFHVARQAIARALEHLGMIQHAGLSPAAKPHLVSMLKVCFKEDGAAFVRSWRNFETVRAGEVIARLADGREICADEDGVIVMPRADCPVGEEWFYLARKVVSA